MKIKKRIRIYDWNEEWYEELWNKEKELGHMVINNGG